MRAALVAALLLLALPAGAAAAPQLVPVGSFSAPVHVAAPPGDTSRLLVVEQEGVIRMVRNGQTLADPFLDVREITANGGERGLLSIAFHPDYAANGLFYYFLTAQAGATPGGELGALTVFEGRRLAADRADPGHRRMVLRVDHSDAANHNGGQLAFGPDGLLYVSTGDGGDQGDPGDDAQRLDSQLGKILRLNPAGGPAQIYALGLRNPWRFSFDRVTGDLIIGDVGGGINEEIDFSPAGTPAGRNYGWAECEGSSPPGCPEVPGAIPPAVNLPHGDGYSGVIGGFVVRDPGLPTLQGRYVFGDLSKPTVMSVALGSSAVRNEGTLPVEGPSSFGEDAAGRVYVASLNGPVYRIHDPASPAPPGGGPPPPQADRVAPVLRIRYRGTQRLRRLRIALRSSEDAAVTVRARRFRTRRVSLTAGERRVVRLKATRRGARRLRRAIARRGRVRVTIRVAARDAAGNRTVRRVRVGVVRRR